MHIKAHTKQYVTVADTLNNGMTLFSSDQDF